MHPAVVVLVLVAFCAAVYFAYDYWKQYHIRKYKTFHHLFHRAFEDVYEALTEAGSTWWPTEGTLIWCLRYGRNFPDTIEDFVDDDIDLMLETATHEEWMQQSQRIADTLMKKGWTGLNRRSTSKKKGTRPDKMQIFLRRGIWVTHLDLHSYLVDEEAGTVHSNGTKDDYPFQYWKGHAPLELIHPFKPAQAYGKVVNCPAQPVEILSHWHDDEYLTGTLKYPLRKLTAEETGEIDGASDRLQNHGFANWAEEYRRIERHDAADGLN